MREQHNDGKSVEFRIELVLTEQKLVFARRLMPIDFNLGPASRLGSYLVEHFDIPRKVRDDGTIDTDLFCFRLTEQPDPNAFAVESIVLFRE